jgi:asparagine synthase (glutamine-hydrolysing)
VCGITGIFNAHAEESVPPALLDRLVDGLAHRGPDDRGSLILGPIGLAARRLSIIDLAAGRQPMSTADGLVHLVCNGEIYNHLELRAELQARGNRFRTSCDIETILLGYREWGIDGLVARLNGIFAFALWDAAARVGHLCRDRLGVKPLYYVDRNGRLVFSSELRALATCGLLAPRVDDVALWGYLTYQFTPDERTLLAGTRKLAPGHILTWREGGTRQRRYWNLPSGGELAARDAGEHADRVEELVVDSIERQMMSDVPIGCFLSGGLDSTIVACTMARAAGRPPRTYSISFPDCPEVDESEHFERVAQQIGATHTTVALSEHEALESLSEVAWAADEPVADPAMLPTFLLSRAAARDVKVVLSGEGADEVFAGYPYYRPFAAASRTPEAGGGPGWKASAGLQRRRGLSTTPASRASRLSGFPYAIDPPLLWQLLHPDHRPDLSRLASLAERIETTAIAGLDGLSSLQAALAVDTKVWLANDLMPKLDKMTMAHSLEGRVPFLDHRLVELAFRLPAATKVGPEHGKLVLRHAMRGVIPDAVRLRRKQGFNVPLAAWFRSSLRDLLRDVLLGPTFLELGLFERRPLERLIDAHMDSGLDFARPLWQLLSLGCWLPRLYREMAPYDPVGRPLELRAARRESRRAEEPACDIVVPV